MTSEFLGAKAGTTRAQGRHPATWPVAVLLDAYRRRELSPFEVILSALARVEAADPQLNAFLTITTDLALEQARVAEDAYRRGEERPLLGIPVSIKDTFHVAGVPTTFGSLIHRDAVASEDSGVVRRLRGAGAVFLGKTNTAEFAQSATTDNRLRADARNPWDPMRTPGGSSGGAAASVAAGLATVAVGTDGGGSIRIPAAFTGLFGLKPTHGRCPDEMGLMSMTEFSSPGPLAWRVADARVVLEVLAERAYPPEDVGRLRIAWCARPEARPVDEAVAASTLAAVTTLERLGHDVVACDLPLAGWRDAFEPLVLDEEWRERGHLLDDRADELTSYEMGSLRKGRDLTPEAVERARQALAVYRNRVATLFDSYDLLCTPAVATPAFPVGRRPTEIDGQDVDPLWGAFPFAVPFNVACTSAASVPCGLADGLPVGLQLVGPPDADRLVLNVAEALESALGFDAGPVLDRWMSPKSAEVSVAGSRSECWGPGSDRTPGRIFDDDDDD